MNKEGEKWKHTHVDEKEKNRKEKSQWRLLMHFVYKFPESEAGHHLLHSPDNNPPATLFKSPCSKAARIWCYGGGGGGAL